MKAKSIFLFLCCLLCLPMQAQQTDIATKLQQAYSILNWGSDFETAENLLSGIAESDIADESDTTKYLFYYCNAGLMDMKEVQTEIKTDYIRKAISLREQSLGIHDSEYINLLCALATELEDADPDAAIPLYERAMVIGMYPFYLKTDDDDAAKQAFGRAMWNLAHLYEVKGYEDQLISLYQDSFELLSTNYKAGESMSYIGLFSLANYLWEQEKYNESIDTLNDILTHIESNEGRHCSNYIDILQIQSAVYADKGDLELAISQYVETIQLIYDIWGKYDQKLDYSYSNLYAALLGAHRISDADALLNTLDDYYLHTNNLTRWLNVLFYGAERLEEQQQIESANKLCDKIIERIGLFSIEEQEVVFSKKADLCYKCNDISGAVLWKERAIKHPDQLDRDIFLLDLSDLAALYRISGELSKSLECYRHLKTLLEQENLELNNIYSNTVSEIAGFYENTLSEAESIWRESITHIESKYNRENATYAICLTGLGVVMFKTDNIKSAFSMFQQVKKLYEQLNMTETSEYANSLHNMGRAYMLRKQYKQAKTYLEQAKTLQIQLSGSVFERTEQYLSELESLMSK